MYNRELNCQVKHISISSIYAYKSTDEKKPYIYKYKNIYTFSITDDNGPVCSQFLHNDLHLVILDHLIVHSDLME